MVFVPDDKLKGKMAKNGSVLQYMYSVSGAGKGLIAMGAMLIPIGVGLAAALSGTLGTQSAVLVAAALGGPGILLLILGVLLQQKREKGWLQAYAKTSGFSEQEVLQADQEFRQPGTVLFSFDKGKDTNSLKKMGFITSTYIRFPGTAPFLRHVNDIVACFYTKKYLCRDGGYDRASVAYFTDGENGVLMDSPPEKASLEIVEAIEARNPMVITSHHFTYEGKTYDAVRDADEVVALHKRLRAEG